MAFNQLFRKKSVSKIMEQLAAGQAADGHSAGLSKQLGVKDLTAFGIAAIIGAGIFSTIGKASFDGGPAVIFLFLFTAVACGFSAFAYAEFASMVPVSGSAYTYSYVAFGELIAWIIGWSLIMEYGIGNITVAISWSDYFTGLLDSGGIHLPEWMTMDYLSASKGFKQVEALMAAGKPFANVGGALQEAHLAWVEAPTLFGFHLILDIPALLIIVLITWLVYRGMKESRNASNAMVLIKLSVVLLVIAVGVFYVDTNNWKPFAPNGITGMLKGISAVFFAYIGFDAISTTAEECRNPQRDLPRGMMWAIIICTVLYIAIALVLTGMVSYKDLSVGDPLAFVFNKLNMKWLSGIIAVSAVVAMASVLLVFQMGQPRIWMSMSRDGLLPPAFSRIHPKFKTPSFATIVTGFVVAVPALFMNLTIVTDLCSIGTLFAFVLVCAGVLRLQNQTDVPKGKFKTPYINGKYVMPVLLVIAFALSWSYNKQGVEDFVYNHKKTNDVSTVMSKISGSEGATMLTMIAKQDSVGLKAANSDLEAYLNSVSVESYEKILGQAPIAAEKKYEEGWDCFKHKIPTWIFIIVCVLMTYWAIRGNLSLIPILGLLCCLYMMSEIGLSNWIGFSVWLVIGLVVYFSYSMKNSKLREA
jgi:amino acid transporter